MSVVIDYPHKLYDTERIARHGRVEQAWIGTRLGKIYASQRQGPDFPEAFKKRLIDPRKMEDYFSLHGFEYGNWLTQEDRWTYYLGAVSALYDLTRLVGFEDSQAGLGGLISLAFGARGKSKALAHFEPRSWAINLTRYKRGAGKTAGRFLADNTGVGSLGHEWAHALDHYLGRMVMKGDFNYGSHIGETTKWTDARLNKLWLKLMRAMVGTRDALSSYHARVKKVVNESSIFGPYWLRRHELFARAFEAWLSLEGERKGRKNPFLNQNKYTSQMYPTPEEVKQFAGPLKTMLEEAADVIPQSARVGSEYFQTTFAYD